MRKSALITLLVAAIFLTTTVLLARIPAETLVGYIGAENAYLLMFGLGLIGGFTTFSGIPYHLVLMSLAAGGGVPWLLGIVTASGVMVGDSVMFGVSKRVGGLVKGGLRDWLESVATIIAHHPRLLAPVLIVYGSISPFSNDFIVASLSMMGFSYKKIIIPLTFGNMLYNIALAYLGYYAYDVVIGFLG